MGRSSWKIISVYTPHVVLDKENKKCFWEALDEIGWGVPIDEKIFIRRDFNWHIEFSSRGYDNMNGGYDNYF